MDVDADAARAEPPQGPESPAVLEAAVHDKLHEEGHPGIEVAGLHVTPGEDGSPTIAGRVGSEKDREWAIGLARIAVGREVHDALEVDETVPSNAPEEVTSGFEQGEGDEALALDPQRSDLRLLDPGEPSPPG